MLKKLEEKIPDILKKPITLFWVFLGVSVFIAVQRYLRGPADYNNYQIFKTSFFHLFYDQNLYRYYKSEYEDLFLYSPTFAMLMGTLAYLPLLLQLILWCSISAISLYIAVMMLPLRNDNQRVAILWFVLIEYVTCLQSMQVSAMIVALIIYAFTCFERGKVFWAAFFIILATFIKIYAIAAVVLFLLYPQKTKFIVSTIFWGILFVVAPLIFVPFNELQFQYHNWMNLTLSIHTSEDTGITPNVDNSLSVMGILKTWFNLMPPTVYVQLAGTALLCSPLLKFKNYKSIDFRLFMLCSLVIWSMIFNHVAESPSYIIPVVGAAVWYVAGTKNWLTNSLIILVFLLTVLSHSSLFPEFVRKHYIYPYVLKALPCVLVWLYLQYQLLAGRFNIETVAV